MIRNTCYNKIKKFVQKILVTKYNKNLFKQTEIFISYSTRLHAVYE